MVDEIFLRKFFLEIIFVEKKSCRRLNVCLVDECMVACTDVLSGVLAAILLFIFQLHTRVGFKESRGHLLIGIKR